MPPACNYDPEANTNDGSCIFEDALGDVALLADGTRTICDDIDECVGELASAGSATALARVFLRV